MTPPVGKSGPLTISASSSIVASGWSIDQRIAQREGLDHTHERVVDGGVAVRVVVFEDLTDDTGALSVFRARVQAHLLHRVEDAALDRLQPVADVRQGALYDHRHRVVEIRRAHLLFDLDRTHTQRGNRRWFEGHVISLGRGSVSIGGRVIRSGRALLRPASGSWMEVFWPAGYALRPPFTRTHNVTYKLYLIRRSCSRVGR